MINLVKQEFLKIVNKLDSLQDREKFMIIFILVAFGIIIYNYINYPLFETIKSNNEKIESLKEKITPKYLNEIQHSKSLIKKLRFSVQNLKDDYNYLSIYIKSKSFLYINEKEFFNILEKILNFKGIDATYTINIEDKKEYRVYKILIEGSEFTYKFKNLYEYLKLVEGLKYIKQLNYFTLNSHHDIFSFKIEVVFWSLK